MTLSKNIRRKKRLQAAFVGLNFTSLSYMYFYLLKRQRKINDARVRRWYVRPINISRPISSEFHSLVSDLYNFDELQGHREYFRMKPERLYDLFERVKPLLRHPPTHAMPIGESLRLSITIKLLASGDTIRNTAKSYRIGYTTAFKIFYETCDALWTVLQPEVLTLPTEQDWVRIAETFWDRWNFPNCLGAIDGKHVVVKKPPKSGSSFFNYKLDHSIVLMAVVDGDYCFTYVDVGGYGRSSDGGIFRQSSFGKALADVGKNSLCLPRSRHLPGSNVRCPFVFVGDAAFPIGGQLLTPFGGRSRTPEQELFDYRLSRARRIVENAFGILAARWQILQRPLQCRPNNAVKIVLATVVLHNFLRKSEQSSTIDPDHLYMPPRMLDFVNEDSGQQQDGIWRQDIASNGALANLPTCRLRSMYGKMVRERFKDYFLTEDGEVSWQYRRFPRLRQRNENSLL